MDDFVGYQYRTWKALVDAVERSSVRHVVFLASVGAQHPKGTGPIAALHRAESAMRASTRVHYTFLRAAYFTENLGMSLGMLGQGVLPSFFPPDFALDMVATADIGRVVASLLVEGTTAHQVVELGGPPRSMNDGARALSTIVGKPVVVHAAPLDAIVPTLTGFGIKPQLAELYREMTGSIISGHIRFEGGHRLVSGSTSLESVLQGLVAGTGQVS